MTMFVLMDKNFNKETVMKKGMGFTLIELLVVISIIALLLSILMPALGKVKESAKMVICSSNQKQLLLGVNAYAASNNGKYPPAITPSWPSYINYHSAEAGFEDLNNAWGIYLLDYLPDVGVYLCPVAPSPAKPDIHQKRYVNYRDRSLIPSDQNGGMHGSYNMLWGGYDFGIGAASGKQFVGPTKMSNKGSKLMACDMMSTWLDDSWFLSHKGKESAGQGPAEDPYFGNDMSMIWWLQGMGFGYIPSKLRMNGGYIDGHVESYTSEETERFTKTFDFYLPANWR